MSEAKDRYADPPREKRSFSRDLGEPTEADIEESADDAVPTESETESSEDEES